MNLDLNGSKGNSPPPFPLVAIVSSKNGILIYIDPIRVEDEEGAEDEDEEGGRSNNHFNRFSTLKFFIFLHFLRWNWLFWTLSQMGFVTFDTF